MTKWVKQVFINRETALYGVSFYLLGDFTYSNVSLHN